MVIMVFPVYKVAVAPELVDPMFWTEIPEKEFVPLHELLKDKMLVPPAKVVVRKE